MTDVWRQQMKSESFRSLRGGERCGAAAQVFVSVCEGVSGIFRESVNVAARGLLVAVGGGDSA